MPHRGWRAARRQLEFEVQESGLASPAAAFAQPAMGFAAELLGLARLFPRQ